MRAAYENQQQMVTATGSRHEAVEAAHTRLSVPAHQIPLRRDVLYVGVKALALLRPLLPSRVDNARGRVHSQAARRCKSATNNSRFTSSERRVHATDSGAVVLAHR